MCLEGLTPGSVSRVPRRRRRISGRASLRFKIGEPHRPQKHRRLPGEDSHSFNNSSPTRNLNEAVGIVAPVPNAAPNALPGTSNLGTCLLIADHDRLSSLLTYSVLSLKAWGQSSPRLIPAGSTPQANLPGF